jgi:hypothetical protein
MFLIVFACTSGTSDIASANTRVNLNWFIVSAMADSSVQSKTLFARKILIFYHKLRKAFLLQNQFHFFI